MPKPASRIANAAANKFIYAAPPRPTPKSPQLLNQIEVPASTVTCAGCHGMRGEGNTEGGITAGNLTWSNLIKPYGHTHTTGRKHGPFTESSFTRAVVNGLDSDGNDLLVAMPRFKLSAADMADLIAYVKRLESDLDPGLTDSSVRIGLVLPSTGSLADVGAAMKDVFTAYFEDVNNKGGIFNRKIELHFADAGAGGPATAGVAQTFATKGTDLRLCRRPERRRRRANRSTRAQRRNSFHRSFNVVATRGNTS